LLIPAFSISVALYHQMRGDIASSSHLHETVNFIGDVFAQNCEIIAVEKRVGRSGHHGKKWPPGGTPCPRISYNRSTAQTEVLRDCVACSERILYFRRPLNFNPSAALSQNGGRHYTISAATG
jgi:hypothetical protein